QPQQALIVPLAGTGALAQPGVVAAAVHAQHPAHRDQAELADVRAHERVLRPYPLAKYAAAFFRMSRSSVTRRSSALSRRISAESLGAAEAPDAGAIFLATCTQPYRVCLGIPIRAATSTTVKPRSITCFTASARHSSVYCLLLPINTSVIAMNYGVRMSTKGWSVQTAQKLTRPSLTSTTKFAAAQAAQKCCIRNPR